MTPPSTAARHQPVAPNDAGRVATFPITNAEFQGFREFYYRKCGVRFAENDRSFVDRRIAERAATKGFDTFCDYFALLLADRWGIEVQQLINALTVNETYFFRERYQLESLVGFVLPEVAARKPAGGTIKIWSLPCSTGEEPYSIAIHILDTWPQSDQYQIEISASDVDTRVLADAAQGVYGDRSLHNVGPDLRARFFRRTDADKHQIVPALRNSIDFSHLNISDRVHMTRFQEIDVIFCRNLLIYFDEVSRREAVAAMHRCLRPGGFLYLGSSESLSRDSSLFLPRRLGDGIVYQRPLVG